MINDVHVVDGTSIVLGLSVFGQWCGLLRFLGYLDSYNMLLRTLKVAAPNVFRFIVCTGILYIAFLLCGWLVMGPYHPKVCKILIGCMIVMYTIIICVKIDQILYHGYAQNLFPFSFGHCSFPLSASSPSSMVTTCLIHTSWHLTHHYRS